MPPLEGRYIPGDENGETILSGPALAVPEIDACALLTTAALLRQEVAVQSPEEAEKWIKEIGEVHRAIRKAMILRLQAVLDAVAGKSLSSWDENVELVRRINTERKAMQTVLLMRDSQESVFLRCAHGPRSRNISIQPVQMARPHKALQSRTVFPNLEVVEKETTS